ncbi:MAG: protocatechuate 3,4-dioxygenase subunit beta [Gammaproteobacteria bacterium]
MRASRIHDRPPPGTQPGYLHPPYASTARRAPRHALVDIPPTATELGRPRLPLAGLADSCDLTTAGEGPPLGERIVVHGCVSDAAGRPLPGTLIELWQANAAGRYQHRHDDHDAPLDPNFPGAGRVVTNGAGEFRFVTLRPGAYPWRNHPNAWRPAHLHFSVFGACLLERLVTQMYFPGDPLLPFDPIFTSIADVGARDRLVARFDWHATVPEYALGYRFDIVLGGRDATPADPA